MISAIWPCPASDGTETAELALTFDQGRAQRVLIIPALFDEANKLRRLTVEVMRRLDAAGVDCFLPDLPGTNESLAALPAQSLQGWTSAMLTASNEFRVTHLLAIRGGGLVAPKVIPGWHFGPVKGASLLKSMLRSRIIAARELGAEESQDSLLTAGLEKGLELGGFALGADMLRQLQDAMPPVRAGLTPLDGEMVGGSPLWLRAEPDDDREQADALAAIVSIGLNA